MDMGSAAVETESHNISVAIHEYVSTMFESEMVEGDDGIHKIFPASLTPDRGAVVSAVCRAIRPTATLEVGMAWGVSTLLILEALTETGKPFAPHVVMDPAQSSYYRNAARRSLRKLGIESLVEFYEAFSELVLPHLLSKGRRFDFIFIDGDHHFDSVFNDWRFAHLMLTPGGTILFDDAWADSVYLVTRYAETNFGYSQADMPIELPVYNGRPAVRAIVKPMQPFERGSWERPIRPFFNDLMPRFPGAMPELLDSMIGECRAARIVMKGGLRDFVETSVNRARDAIRQIGDVLRVAETFAALAEPATAARTHQLLDSVAEAFSSALKSGNPASLDQAAKMLSELKAIFAEHTRTGGGQ
jgi:predicted O-methyltransferase YrrM